MIIRGLSSPRDRTASLRGFRVPCVIVSPFAPRERVSSIVFDQTSVLRMIEWRWDLAPLTVRDETANTLAEALDFTEPSLEAPRYRVLGRDSTWAS